MVQPSHPRYNEGNRVGTVSGGTRGTNWPDNGIVRRPVGTTEHSSLKATVLMRPQSNAGSSISRFAAFALAAVVLACVVTPAHALVVINSGATDTTVAPPDDPGWANVAGGFSRNFVYL